MGECINDFVLFYLPISAMGHNCLLYNVLLADAQYDNPCAAMPSVGGASCRSKAVAVTCRENAL